MLDPMEDETAMSPWPCLATSTEVAMVDRRRTDADGLVVNPESSLTNPIHAMPEARCDGICTWLNITEQKLVEK